MSVTRLHVLEVLGNAIVGGMESYAYRLVERLPGERFRVSVMCPFESPLTERLRSLGVDTLIVSMPEDPSWASLQTTCAFVQSGGVDVLHAHMPNAHLLAALAGRLTGKPVLATIHGRQLTMLDLEVHRTTGSRLNVVCRQTYYQALGLGVDADRLSFIPNGVDTAVYRPAPRLVPVLRPALGIRNEDVVVGFVGRLSAEKGPDLFVRMAAIAHVKAPDAHFVLIGEGPMRGELESMIADAKLGARVHLAGLREDLPSVYNELDVLASTSRSEAMPLALMEAMACGLPVVGLRAGGVPDLIEQGVTGFLVGLLDHESAARCVLDLIAAPALRARMAEAARARTLRRFDLDDNVEQVAQLLARLAAPRGATRRMSAVPSGGGANAAR